MDAQFMTQVMNDCNIATSIQTLLKNGIEAPLILAKVSDHAVPAAHLLPVGPQLIAHPVHESQEVLAIVLHVDLLRKGHRNIGELSQMAECGTVERVEFRPEEVVLVSEHVGQGLQRDDDK